MAINNYKQVRDVIIQKNPDLHVSNHFSDSFWSWYAQCDARLSVSVGLVRSRVCFPLVPFLLGEIPALPQTN